MAKSREEAQARKAQEFERLSDEFRQRPIDEQLAFYRSWEKRKKYEERLGEISDRLLDDGTDDLLEALRPNDVAFMLLMQATEVGGRPQTRSRATVQLQRLRNDESQRRMGELRDQVRRLDRDLKEARAENRDAEKAAKAMEKTILGLEKQVEKLSKGQSEEDGDVGEALEDADL